MKKTFYMILAAAFFIAGCQKKEEQPGSIYGSVSDKATGELIKTAAVELQPGGTKHQTGTDGYFEIQNLKAGNYTLNVSKTGYSDVINYQVSVENGKTTRIDVPMEKLPPALRIVNDSQKDINELDFGSALSDVSRSFNIFNDSPESLEWDITKTAEWITNISRTSGTLKAGATQVIVITIDREKLAGGENTTSVHITSDNGSKQLTVKATGEVKILPTLNTLAATSITTTTATLNGEILTDGTPAYTERGFVYSLSPMPTLETTIAKITASVTSENNYSATVTGLTLNNTYYVRAYAINKAGKAYSTNEISFKTAMVAPEVTTQDVTNKKIGAGTATFNGTIVKIGDPGYTERGFVYGLTHNPTIESDTKKTVTGLGTGVFSFNATELIQGKIYYVRAFATNAQGTAYGAEKVCDFNAIMPEVKTNAATNIDATKATLNGSISSVGDPAYTKRGFVYGTNNTPTIGNGTNKEVAGTGIGSFNVDITGLTLGATYYFRAYVISSGGTKYGDVLSFKAESPHYVILESAKLMVQKTDIGIGSWSSMNSLCNNSLLAGLKWRMPTINELAVIYNESNNIGGFVTTYSSYYWSSSINYEGYYWAIDFNNGTQSISYYSGNNKSNYCRCVRTMP